MPGKSRERKAAMTQSRKMRSRRIAKIGIMSLVAALPAGGLVWAQDRPTLSFFGAPGMVDMPVATPMRDGDVSLSVGGFDSTARGALNFQITPRLSGSFRYSWIDEFNPGPEARFDRSFDLRFLLIEETDRLPALTIGLQDFGGTGIYSGEYLVGTKTFGRLRATAGLGWGRFGSRNGFDNPLGFLSSEFDDRGDITTGIGDTGQLDFSDWFRGEAAIFGGLQYMATDQLVLTLEYSSDAYETEEERLGFEQDSPINLAATYRFHNGLDLTGAWLYGNTFGLAMSYTFNPANPPAGDPGPGGPRVTPRASAADLGWSLPAEPATGVPAQAEAGIAERLAAEGITLVALQRQGSTLRLHLRNDRYYAEAQGLGRAARALTGVLPPEVETLVLIPMREGVALSAVTLQRSDLEELSGDVDGAWKSYARSDIADARPYRADLSRIEAPRLSYALDGYLGPTFSDPDNPVAEGGLRFDASYRLAPGLSVKGQLRQPLVRPSSHEPPVGAASPDVPQVRSDAGYFDDDSDLEIRELTLDHIGRPAPDYYSRLSVGYLEQMYAGVSGELLWKPVSGPLALGAEVNYVTKRDPDEALGLGDYDVVTGHVSAYYDFGQGYMGQIDAGRYLAGDWGATFALDREFDNGFSLGAYFTLTDVSKDDFGEGSFDKGIRFSIPLSWFTGEPSRRTFDSTLRPINGDGGARLQVSNRLYDEIRQGHVSELREDWGSFWE